MKKLLSISLVALLLLTSCGNKVAQVSNKNETVITVGDKNITKGELYGYMSAYVSSASYLKLRKLIVEHYVPITAELEKEAQENLEQEKKELGDSFLATILEIGYKDEADYYQNAVLQTVRAIEMFKQYIKTNLTTLADDYKPYQIRLMQFDSESKATSALDQVKDGQDFEAVAKEHSNLFYQGLKEVVVRTTNYPKVVLETITEQTGPTLIQKVITDEVTKKYYVIQVIATDVTKFEAEFIERLQIEEQVINDLYAEYAKAGKFTVYDINVLETLQDNYPDLFE